MQAVQIESLDHEGRGVAHPGGKAVFVEGALPQEIVEYASTRNKTSYEIGRVTRVIKESPWRNEPRCTHFGVCGGCSMQHLDPSAQVAVKQRVLEDAFWHIARLKPETMLPPIYGQAWGYRHRARLSVRLVLKKGGVLVGFHEKRSSYVAEMSTCEILPPDVARLIVPLRELVGALSISDRLPQIEVAAGDVVTVLVLRILDALSVADEALVRAFADANKVCIYLQPKGPDTAYRYYPLNSPELDYALPDFDIRMRFRPTDFTQVNHALNRVLVRKAIGLLQPGAGERVIDWFCGLGNFTLPIARMGARVMGIEGSPALVARARENAVKHGLDHLADFADRDLFEIRAEDLQALGRADKWLVDPPREGAAELVKAITPDVAPDRIVYVSCQPATLARDAAILVREKGYVLRAAGVANMFPHTSHVESIALLERSPSGTADAPV